jgi:uncharacterized small protein (DUF1192 family)
MCLEKFFDPENGGAVCLFLLSGLQIGKPADAEAGEFVDVDELEIFICSELDQKVAQLLEANVARLHASERIEAKHACQENNRTVELAEMTPKAHEKRTHLNVRIPPSLKDTLESFASKEKRGMSNLAEVLLEWAVEQLKLTGSTIALLETHAVPTVGGVVRRTVDAEREVYDRLKPRSRKKAANE